MWNSGKVRSDAQNDIQWGGTALRSREGVVWQVRVWNTRGKATGWSRPASWEMGLLQRGDWGSARWIEHPGRNVADPLPIFARAFRVDTRRRSDHVAKARLYLSGVGIQDAKLNGQPVTDEVLAPGNSNYQLSTEYRTYDVTSPDPSRRQHRRRGARTRDRDGHALRHQPGDRPQRALQLVAEPAEGQRHARRPGGGGRHGRQGRATSPNYHLGGTINIDTGDGGDRLESRKITSIGTAGPDGTGISFEQRAELAARRGRNGHGLR